ncbi:leucine-rich repeat-containing protein 49 isoform X3 [Alligator mississippiensis]|uniref:leucine-rich repeat-containing protein 49 isoform X3 n=1 Tax=Alligator mississippiensis TaxID=8496 RepID=UPI002877F1C9|nr:leucine-rich repeat-containing protein 49 isoform X3 [Alligator mississippiensis]
MVPSKCRPGRGSRAGASPVNSCGLQLVIQTSSVAERNKPFELRINKEQSSFHSRLLQHDLEKNYAGRPGDGRILSPLVRNKQVYVAANLPDPVALEFKESTGAFAAFGDSSGYTTAKSRPRQESHTLGSNISDNTNFGSNSSVTAFPILQRTAEEKILNSDRLTLERQKLTACPIIDGEEHLRLLNFQHNFITRIQNISNLQHLVFLDLYDNQIEEISGLSTLRALRVLLLGKNRIKKISNLENLKNLDVLDLHGNQVAKIENIGHLGQLRVLNLARNLLASVENLNGLHSLTELNLRHNQITSIKDVDTLPCLQRLFLSFNNISSFDDILCLADSSSLSDITLDGNPIAQESWYKHTVLHHMMQLRQLDMKRITEEERRVASVAARKEEEKKRESNRQTLLKHLKFKETNIVTLQQFNALAQVHRIEQLTVDHQGNPIVSFTLWKYYVLFRLNHFNLQKINGTKITQNDIVMAERLFGILAYVASSEFPHYRLLLLLGESKKKQWRYLLEAKGKKPGTGSEESSDNRRFGGENTSRAILNYTTRDLHTEKLEEIKEREKFCQTYIQDLVKEAADINMKNESLQKLWPQMFIELVRDAVIEIRNKNSYMRLCLQRITDQK